MAIGYYFDEHMRHSVAAALTEHGIEVLMAVDVDMVEKADDTKHLPFAAERNLVMMTFDRPFAGRTMSRTDHAG
jgi:predicted nuclease of predicted toxin-antitoxin system